jgi:hypothetical protein
MMDLKKHLNKIKLIPILIVAAALCQGCNGNKPRKDYVAKVNNSYLTSEEVAEMIDTSAGKKFYRNEVVKNWIEKELLFQAALEDGITKDAEFQRLMENSKKELAISLYLQNYLDNTSIRYSDKDLETFYDTNKNDFKLFADTYIINRVDFINEDKAVLFRNTVMETNWNKALNMFSEDSSFILSYVKKKLYDYEIHPAELYRVITELNPMEVSILLTFNEGMYTIVQVEEKYLKESIPSFQLVRSEVESRFIKSQKDQAYRELMKDLYSNNEIEIKTR